MKTVFKKHENEHLDESEILKRELLNSQRRRKWFAKVAYRALWIIAFIIFVLLIFSYTV